MGIEAITYTLDLVCDCCGKDIQVEGAIPPDSDFDTITAEDICDQGWDWSNENEIKLYCNVCLKKWEK